MSAQVLTGETLRRLNTENIDDLLKSLPDVTAGGFGSGQEGIYMRDVGDPGMNG